MLQEEGYSVLSRHTCRMACERVISRRATHTDTHVHATIRSYRVARENRLRTFTSADPSEALLLKRSARKSDLLQAS